MIVFCHPSVDMLYEHTKFICQPDPVHNYEETLGQVLKTRLEEKDEPLSKDLLQKYLAKCSLLLSTVGILVGSIIDVRN